MFKGVPETFSAGAETRSASAETLSASPETFSGSAETFTGVHENVSGEEKIIFSREKTISAAAETGRVGVCVRVSTATSPLAWNSVNRFSHKNRRPKRPPILSIQSTGCDYGTSRSASDAMSRE